MPMVQSTLNWSMYKRFFKLSDMFANQLLPGLQGIRLYGGRAYVNLSIQQWLMYDMLLPEESPFKQALRSFLAKCGHWAVYELEIKNPRWREDPSYLVDVIKSTMKSDLLSQIRSGQKEKADQTWQEVNQRVPYDERTTISSMLKNTLKGRELREQSKSMLVKLSESYRLVFQEAGRRFTKNGIYT